MFDHLTSTLSVPTELSTKKTSATDSKFNELILILNPNSQGGGTGKNRNETYEKIKEFLPNRHRIIFTKKANDEHSSRDGKDGVQEYRWRRRRWWLRIQ